MSRNLLQLLDFVTAPLQQIDHAPRSGEVSSACHDRRRLAAPYFRFDAREATLDYGDRAIVGRFAIFLSQTGVSLRKRSNVALLASCTSLVDGCSADFPRKCG